MKTRIEGTVEGRQNKKIKQKSKKRKNKREKKGKEKRKSFPHSFLEGGLSTYNFAQLFFQLIVGQVILQKRRIEGKKEISLSQQSKNLTLGF